MTWSFMFFLNSVLLGVGLAMDAFSVSLANALNEPKMSYRKMCVISSVFAFFQALMPMLGWFCVRTIVQFFFQFEKLVPWIAFVLLTFIGGKMLLEGIRGQESKATKSTIGFLALFLQGIATSIDALSVGFAIADYGFLMAFVAALIIAAVTFLICMIGLVIGKKVGTKFSEKATILGGVILLVIGVEIFVTGVFFN